MKNDALQQFVDLRNSLIEERDQLQDRLSKIQNILGGAQGVRNKISRKAGGGRRGRPRKITGGEIPTSAKAGKRPRRILGGFKQNELSLREAVAKVTSGNPLTKPEIVDAVQKIGYRFKTKKPLNTLNAMLYTCRNPKFRRRNKKFSPA